MSKASKKTTKQATKKPAGSAKSSRSASKTKPAKTTRAASSDGRLDPEKTAVLFIDFQVDVCGEGGRMLKQDPEILDRYARTRANAGALLKKLRSGKPRARYLHIAHGWPAGYPALQGARTHAMNRHVQNVGAFQRGTPGAAIVSELTPTPEEPVLWKQTISAFSGAPVALWLNQRGIENVALTGVVTHYAVLSAGIAAADLGYRVFVLSDCCNSGTDDRHLAALQILEPLTEVVASEAFLKMFA